MKLITFQSMEALKVLVNQGYLFADKEYIDVNRYGIVYDWITQKMNEQIPNIYGAAYPIWCWVKFKNGICPPKHKGEPVKGFDVKITFHKNQQDVFVTDYRRYSFLLNNVYIPESTADLVAFEQELERCQITKEDLAAFMRTNDMEYSKLIGISEKVRESFDRCITSESDVLQGCIWKLDLKDVEKIEILHDDGYRYGSFNYVRRDGKRFDWIEDYYRMLK